MSRFTLALDQLKVESFATGGASATHLLSTSIDTVDTSPPACNTVQTCIC
jgi:hypothetical protein